MDKKNNIQFNSESIEVNESLNTRQKKEWNKPVINNLIDTKSTELGGADHGDDTTSTS